MRGTLPAVAVSAAAFGAVPSGAVAHDKPDPCRAPVDQPQSTDPKDTCLCPTDPAVPTAMEVPTDPAATAAPPDPAESEMKPTDPACDEPKRKRQHKHATGKPPADPKPDAPPGAEPRKKPHLRHPAPDTRHPRPKTPPPATRHLPPAAPTHQLHLSQPKPASVHKAVRELDVPLFLLPIYRAAEARYGVPWALLAAINQIESDFGRNPSVSSAGAVGWMQFMPPTWGLYGQDANRDRRRDPFNPIDAIFSAARYLSASGVASDPRSAVFAYNHAEWYVDDVLARARRIQRTVAPLLDVLTGLAYARVPVLSPPAGWRMARRDGRPGVTILAKPGSRVVAVNDGVIVAMGRSRRLGRYVVLRDAQGNRFMYARLGALAGHRAPAAQERARARGRGGAVAKVRLFAHPARPRSRTAGGLEQLLKAGVPVAGYSEFWEVGSRVTAGTVLGEVGGKGRFRFEIRPAGKDAPPIDPRPILESWRQLASAGAFRPSGMPALDGTLAQLSIRQGLRVPLRLLERRVLHDSRIAIYPCGRADIASGWVDRRVLVTLEFLAASNLAPTVTSLECGHSYYTTSGNVSEHTTGDAVDIAAVNGIPILGHQGSDSITDVTIRRLLTLSGDMKPHQIISLMTYDGADNTMSLPDHANHIHVGFHPRRRPGLPARVRPLPPLRRDDWLELSSRLRAIPQPAVPVPARMRARPAARGR
jgi:murein DD-endopeptidase MepM/ murein hydrolase activator NlpD